MVRDHCYGFDFKIPVASRSNLGRCNPPSIGTKPNVVFNPTMPQHAAGTRMEPAVSVPNATSASLLAIATAERLDEPPGIKCHYRSLGFTGVP